MRCILVLMLFLVPAASGSDHTYPPAKTEYTTPEAGYPLKLFVMSASRSYHYHNGELDRVRQTGIANLLTDPQVGVAYNSTCSDGFHHNHTGMFYQAKWKKPNARLEILTLKPGASKPSTCEVDVVVQPTPYTKQSLKQDEESS